MENDRTLQIAILELLGEYEGKSLDQAAYRRLLELAEGNERKLSVNLTYLARDGFIAAGRDVENPLNSLSTIRLLNKGVDFLMGDGGITVYKNTVTVRFHAETVQLLERIIEKSVLPPQQKSSLRERLRELPFSAIEHLITSIVEKGGVHLLERFLAM